MDKQNKLLEIKKPKEKIKRVKKSKCICCKSTTNLTYHHLFHKSRYSKQPMIEENLKFIVLCRKCHNDLHKGIFTREVENIVVGKLDKCKTKYGMDVNKELREMWFPIISQKSRKKENITKTK